MRTTISRTMLVLALALPAAGAAWANPPVETVNRGACLELKVDGKPAPCNGDFRLVDDGAGEVSLVTGYGDGRAAPKTVAAFFTAQAPNMENAYGYALRVTGVTLMPHDRPDNQRLWKAGGLCFLVKPNPVRAGATAIRQDIVVMCTANFADAAAPVRRIDWKFVY